MDWGLMQGIGDGMQIAGQSIMGNAKDKKLAELREQETIRKENRDTERADALVKDTKIEADADGAMWVNHYNRNDKKIGESTLATPEQIKATRDEDLKRKLTLDKLAQEVSAGDADATLKGFKVRDYDADRALDIKKDEAQIGLSNTRGIAAMITANKPRAGAAGGVEAATTKRDYVELVKSKGRAILSDAVDPEGGKLSGAEQDDIAEKAVQRAIVDQVDPIVALKQLIQETYDHRSSKTKNKDGTKVDTPINWR